MAYKFCTLQSKKVCIVTPKDYRRSGKILFHFHGFRQMSFDSADQNLMDKFNFQEIMDGFASDTLMVVPLGTVGHGGEHYSLMRDWGSIYKIIPALKELGEPYTDVIISGHSAAYQPITNILDGGTGDLPVSKVFLFDSLYSRNIEPFSEFLKQPTNRVWNVAIPGGTPFMNAMFITTKYENYINIRATGTKLVTVDHYSTVTKYLPFFLKNSRL